MAVFAIVVGVALPAIQWARRASALKTTMDNLSQCAKAVHRAHDQHKTFPPYYGVYGGNPTPMTFHAHLLLFVDQGPLYQNLVSTAVVPAYLSPMDPSRADNGAGAANFPVNLRLFYTYGGIGTLSPPNNPIYPKMPQSFQQRGTNDTLLFATKYQLCGKDGGSVWMDPGNNAPNSPTAATFGANMTLWQQAPTQAACDPFAGTAVSFTVEVIQVALCDASVLSVSAEIDPATWESVHPPNYVKDWGNRWEN